MIGNGPDDRGLVPGRGRNISFDTITRLTLVPAKRHPIGAELSFSGIKQQEQEAVAVSGMRGAVHSRPVRAFATLVYCRGDFTVGKTCSTPS